MTTHLRSHQRIERLIISRYDHLYKSKGFGSLIILSNQVCVNTIPCTRYIRNELIEANASLCFGFYSVFWFLTFPMFWVSFCHQFAPCSLVSCILFYFEELPISIPLIPHLVFRYCFYLLFICVIGCSVYNIKAFLCSLPVHHPFINQSFIISLSSVCWFSNCSVQVCYPALAAIFVDN